MSLWNRRCLGTGFAPRAQGQKYRLKIIVKKCVTSGWEVISEAFTCGDTRNALSSWSSSNVTIQNFWRLKIAFILYGEYTPGGMCGYTLKNVGLLWQFMSFECWDFNATLNVKLVSLCTNLSNLTMVWWGFVVALFYFPRRNQKQEAPPFFLIFRG